MTHPEELLAGYLDGVLAPEERAVVETHLAACARCREEVELARRALVALSTLAEEPVPLGVTGPVLAEARRRAEPRWQRSRWAAGFAAAAALLVAGAIVLPQVLRGISDGAGADRGAAPAGLEAAEDQERLMGPALPPLEARDADLDEADARRLAALQTSDAGAWSYAPEAARDEAVSCLVESGASLDDQHVLVRLISARYLGTPAYLAVFHEGPGGDQPPTRVVVWVVARADCRILTLLSQNL